MSTVRPSLCTEPSRFLPNFFHVSAAPLLKSVDVLKCSLSDRMSLSTGCKSPPRGISRRLWKGVHSKLRPHFRVFDVNEAMNGVGIVSIWQIAWRRTSQLSQCSAATCSAVLSNDSVRGGSFVARTDIPFSVLVIFSVFFLLSSLVVQPPFQSIVRDPATGLEKGMNARRTWRAQLLYFCSVPRSVLCSL